MLELYAHQKKGVKFLVARSSAGLFWEMGTGKSRTALVAAQQLFSERKIDRVLILAPAAVRAVWREEMDKIEGRLRFIPCIYEPKKQIVYGTTATKLGALPVMVLSYALLPQERHVKALAQWCLTGNALLICDESSFLKSRMAKQTKGSQKIASVSKFCWLLTGTPIANSPLDLWGQGSVMSGTNGNSPLRGFKNYYHFRSRYATLQLMHLGRKTFQQVVGYQHLDELTEKFKPYVLRRMKAECLDLPEKSYTIREVQLSDATWRIYNELRREALLALPDEDVRPEPNAATRILRLAQITSGIVGGIEK